ncbi:MAG TPA: T9SS type A sorting domain-containing protein, partial [Candidatus Kapabacteria bacterium]
VGYLDETFGDGGVVTAQLQSPQSMFPANLKILPNGDIMHCGTIHHSGDRPKTYIMKHRSDGSVDSSFGDNGYSSFLSNFRMFNSYLYVYPDGRLLIYGDRVGAFGIDQQKPSIVRVLANGTIDTSFGDSGWYVPDSSILAGTFFQVKVNADGSIIALGSRNTRDTVDFIYTPTITRISSAGRNDTSFGDAGTKIVGTQIDSGHIHTAIFYKDNRCIFSCGQPISSKIGLRMFSTDLNGVIDSSFGTNGVIEMQLSDDVDYITAIAEEPSGKLLCIADRLADGGRESILIRFSPDGTLDNSFGSYGVAASPTYTYEYSLTYLTLDSSMNILAAGHLYDSARYDYPIISHYHGNGTPDSSHGGDGTIKEMSKYMRVIYSIAVQSDGKYLVMGFNYASDDGRAIARICLNNNTGKAAVYPTSKNPSTPVSLHPTPSTDNCTVTYTLPTASKCTITLRDESGREVRTFVQDEYRTAGEHEEELDLRSLPIGAYFLQIVCNGSIQTAKLIKQ